MRRKMKNSVQVIEVETYYNQAQLVEDPGVKQEWTKQTSRIW